MRKGTRLVRALYANFSVGRILEILQDNSRHLCVQLPKTKFIAKVHIDGATARLSRWCGVQGIPSCKSHVQILVLTWVKKGRSYLAISEGVRRAHIIGFARSLVRVR